MFQLRNKELLSDDASLVMYSLGGDRDAFCQIVTRYQNLLCSIAYSSIGDIKQSEDVAQETFIEAWRKLDTLRDPAKLKSWLCGILRFKVSRFRRKEATEPANKADELLEQGDVANASEMDESAIQQQQEALLWTALDNMAPKYREPLVLFYREQQSVERVASELDLSPDNVKQRLSRGRKLLKQAMSSFVEDALQKSKPGVAFTTGVLAAISGISPPAKAAAFGVGVSKAGTVFKLTTMLTILAVCSGFISSFFGLRASLDQSRTERERKLVIKVVLQFLVSAIIFVAVMLGLKYLAFANEGSAAILAILSQVAVFAFMLLYFFLAKRMLGTMQSLRAHERLFSPDAFLNESDKKDSKQSQYISKLHIWGVPLVHFQFGMPESDYKPAFAWIAGGSYARGLLFAWGGVAIAPISVGIVAFGALSVGAIGLGFLSMGTVAIGVIGFGASAIGYKAYSSLSSLGWESAVSGGFSIAKDGAIGAIAFAEQANTEAASQITSLAMFEQHYAWALAAIALLVIVPAALHAHKVRQRMKVK